TILMVRIIELNQMDQHEVWLVGIYNVLAYSGAPPVRARVAAAGRSHCLFNEARRRILQRPFRGGWILFGVKNLRHKIIYVCAYGYGPADAAGNKPGLLCHRPERFGFQSVGEPIPFARLWICRRFEYAVLDYPMQTWPNPCH